MVRGERRHGISQICIPYSFFFSNLSQHIEPVEKLEKLSSNKTNFFSSSIELSMGKQRSSNVTIKRFSKKKAKKKKITVDSFAIERFRFYIERTAKLKKKKPN
ncbi:hypothetical protein TYRP_011890 [Tyrophagus putrescentiae]|nr:hypothetical protein TYRP_011890 [Tyrophagus putrescentiae]